MNIFENKQYQEDLKSISSIELPWEKLYNRSILISGASGLMKIGRASCRERVYPLV